MDAGPLLAEIVDVGRAELFSLFYPLFEKWSKEAHYSDQQLDLLRHLHFSTCEMRDPAKRITLSPSTSKILRFFFYAVSEIAISADVLGLAYFFTD